MRSNIITTSTMTTICMNFVGCMGMDVLRVGAPQHPHLDARGHAALGGLKKLFKRACASAGYRASRSWRLSRERATWQLQQSRLLASIA